MIGLNEGFGAAMGEGVSESTLLDQKIFFCGFHLPHTYIPYMHPAPKPHFLTGIYYFFLSFFLCFDKTTQHNTTHTQPTDKQQHNTQPLFCL